VGASTSRSRSPHLAQTNGFRPDRRRHGSIRGADPHVAYPPTLYGDNILNPGAHIDKRFVLHIPSAGGDFVTGIGDVARCPASTEEHSKRADDNELLGLSHRRTARRRASNKFAAASPLEGSGFEPVWGSSCQVVVSGLWPVFCSEQESRSSSRRLRSGLRSARKGSRDRNASKLSGVPLSGACVWQRLEA